MATLEKIRQQKKILAVVIGGALLAFIIEVGIEAIGRMGGNSTAAKVGNEKIDYMALQRRVEQEAAADQNNPNSDQIDPAVRQQQVLETMINEKLLQNEYDKVGIDVTDNEISEFMIGKRPAPAAMQMAQQVGFETPAQLHEFLQNPASQGVQAEQVVELQQEWNKLKDNLVQQIKFAKLQSLVAGSLQANKLDLAQMAEEEATTSYITYVKKDFSSLEDDKFPVSKEELQAEWNKNKKRFNIDEETRQIHYIAVNITPSQADIAAADKVANRAWAALQKGTGIDSVRVLGTVQVDTAMNTLDKFTQANVRSFLSAAAIGATKRDSVPGNKYTMYKLINKMVSLDSVQFSFCVVQGDKKTQDSVLNMLKAGKTVAEVTKTVKNAQGQDEGVWNQIASAPDSIKAKFANAPEGYFAMMTTDQGAQFIKVLEKKAPKTFYTLATVTYEAYASQATIDGLRNKLQDFLNKNKTAFDFDKNAAAAGYQAINEMITASTPQLGANPYTRQGIRDSRKAIKWAFEAKKNTVSPIFTDNKDILLAVDLNEVFDAGYLPYDAPGVEEELTARVRNNKKAEALLKQYEGKAKDLASLAQLMGTQVDSAQVNFSQDMIGKIGMEPAMIGRVAAAKENTFVGPFKGNSGIYAFTVVKRESDQRKPTDDELRQRYAQTRGAGITASQQGIAALLGKATKVTRSLIQFF